MILTRKLQKWGHDVLEAATGTEGWDAVREDRPDIAILDWMMPGLDGIDLCRKIRLGENLSYVYIIMLTDKGQEKDMITAFQGGADDYIVKPFREGLLRSRVAVGEREKGSSGMTRHSPGKTSNSESTVPKWRNWPRPGQSNSSMPNVWPPWVC